MRSPEERRASLEKGVGDKGDVGRRDVRQAAPVGRPAVFPLFSPSSGVPSVAFGGKDLPRLLRRSASSSRFSLRNERNASLGIKEERRLQTAPATPCEWRPSQTNRIPVSIPLRCRRRLRRELPSAPTPSTSLLLPRLPVTTPLARTPAFVPAPRARLRFSLRHDAGRRGRFPDVTTLFSRFNRDPDYVVRRRFARADRPFGGLSASQLEKIQGVSKRSAVYRNSLDPSFASDLYSRLAFILRVRAAKNFYFMLIFGYKWFRAMHHLYTRL